MNVVSFGGGTNSTAMIIGMYLHKIPIDLILIRRHRRRTAAYIRIYSDV